jgi:MFS family permease
VLLVGWSVLKGVGAALIMPAIVALVASNSAQPQRPRAYGLVASAGAIAVAACCGSSCGGSVAVAPGATPCCWRVPPKTADAVVIENANARIAGLRSSLSLPAAVALIALFLSRRIPAEQPSARPAGECSAR